MAHVVPQTNGFAEPSDGRVHDILPGTTFPEKREPRQDVPNSISTPLSFPGPEVNSRPTTVTLFSPSQLVGSPLLPSFHSVVNKAYQRSHEKNGAILLDGARFSYEGQFLDELANAPGTFTFIIYYTDTDDVVGTASAKRHIGKVNVAGEDSTFTRLSPAPADTDAWELSTMAVDPELQRQGLAAYLMRLTEDEVKRRFVADCPGARSKRLVMMITTVKEINEPFYLRRGFMRDYEIWYDQGHLGSECGFHIEFMSKTVNVDDLL